MQTDGTRAAWSGLWLSQLLALALLCACLWWNYRELSISFSNHPVLPSLIAQEALNPVLLRQLAAFAAAAWLVHAWLGLIAFALARLTERALEPVTRVRRGILVLGWFTALAAIVFAANSRWYPTSIFAGDAAAQDPGVGELSFQWIVLGLALVVVALASLALWRRKLELRAVAIAAILIAAPAAAAVLPAFEHSNRPGTAANRPHIVIVGIDSLRADLSLPRHGDAQAPALSGFLRDARQFSDATSPLARTYGAWVSILTGRHPVATNARVNLMPRRLVHEGETLPEALRASGYRTVYATDESRFANFDASFGFDAMVNPPVGAADFVLGYGGDLPLVNLVAATPLGQWLFPSNHANRGAYVTYRPSQFIRRLEGEVAINGPTFLAIHLTLAHWPYTWAGRPLPTQPAQYRDAYAEAVVEVDRQFAAVMQLLHHKGVLDNAIVVLLSDHGEALGGEDDSMLRGTGSSREVWDSLWGHGTSVMSPRQYQVLLGFRAFGRARLPGPAQAYDWPVTLEDLRPTLEELATGVAPRGVDGVSLVPYMADPASAQAMATRVRFTETDFNTPRTLAGRYEVTGIVDEAAVFYEIDPATGWVQFRPDRLPALLAAKQRAAFSPGSLLAAIPGSAGGPVRYLFTSRHSPHPEALEGPPEAWADPEARHLWTALRGRFGEESGAGSGLP